MAVATQDETSDFEASSAVPENVDEYRENRFDGPDHEWLKYTRDERALIQHLDEEQANDLSIHLYNAHATKVRHYDSSNSIKPWRSKRSWLNHENGTVPWHAPQSWTAWPMSSADVPRVEERHGNLEQMMAGDEGIWRRPEHWYPSVDLEDELLALIMRRAKEQLRARPPASSLAKPGRPIKRESEEDSDELASLAEGPMPVPQVILDDEGARLILTPDIRHIISGLDNLLSTLHKSRSGHITQQREGRSQDKKRKRSSTAAELRAQADGSMHDHERSTTSQLATRDWSEVLGLASIIGWDTDVLRTTKDRCSSLFGEDMNLARPVTALTSIRVAAAQGNQKGCLSSVAQEL